MTARGCRWATTPADGDRWKRAIRRSPHGPPPSSHTSRLDGSPVARLHSTRLFERPGDHVRMDPDSRTARGYADAGRDRGRWSTAPRSVPPLLFARHLEPGQARGVALREDRGLASRPRRDDSPRARRHAGNQEGTEDLRPGRPHRCRAFDEAHARARVRARLGHALGGRAPAIFEATVVLAGAVSPLSNEEGAPEEQAG